MFFLGMLLIFEMTSLNKDQNILFRFWLRIRSRWINFVLKRRNAESLKT